MPGTEQVSRAYCFLCFLLPEGPWGAEKQEPAKTQRPGAGAGAGAMGLPADSHRSYPPWDCRCARMLPPPQLSPTATCPPPPLSRDTVSLLTLALMGPTRLQNEMMSPPRAHGKCQRVSWGKDGSPRIGVGVVPSRGAVDAFTPSPAEKDWEGCCLELQLPIKDGGTCVGGNQNR